MNPSKNVARLLDANGNRAREALRVMEDAARFLRDDAKLAERFKRLRHDLADVLRRLDRCVPGGLDAARNIGGDVGTRLTTESEAKRADVRQVVIAAEKRAGEALRCMEEYGKLIDAAAAAACKQMRYQAYDMAQRLLAALPLVDAHWRLCVIVTESLCAGGDWLGVAKASLEAGADCLQLREKNLPDRVLLQRAEQLRQLRDDVRPKAAILVNDSPQVAALAGVEGVHLGQEDLSAADARRIMGCGRLVGISTHNLREAAAAHAQGANYCGVGAIFSTATKQRKPSGLVYLRKFVQRHPNMPHLAIGGITPDNVREVIDAGAKGIAVSSIVCGASRPATVLRKLRKAMGR